MVKMKKEAKIVNVPDERVHYYIDMGYKKTEKSKSYPFNGIDFYSMTIPQLEQYASENNKNLDGATTKQEIIEALQKA